MAKFNKRKFINMDFADISKMKKPEIASLLKQATAEIEKVAKSFESPKNRNIYSEALENYKKREGFDVDSSLPHTKATAINKMKRNAMIAELASLQQFFMAKSSTVSGARDIKRASEVNVFGAAIDPVTGKEKRTKEGKLIPAKRFTREEADTYWSNYNEFKNQNPNWESIWGSDRIMQVLRDMREARTKKFGADELSDIKVLLNKKRKNTT